MSIASVLAEIGDERQRQICEEGFTREHDDTHALGELAYAAACYAAGDATVKVTSLGGHVQEVRIWPWSLAWWKPGPNRRRNLVKAAALLVAEIERFDRAGPA